MTLLMAYGLVRRYDGSEEPALDGVTLQVAAGEFVAIAGPSGSGKTTLLAILGGLDRPDSGRVLLSGEDVYARSTDALARLRAASISFVFQSHNLISTLTVLENVELAVWARFGAAIPAYTRADRALRALNLDTKRARLPGRLSIGEQQRAAVARAIAVEPKLLIADEPTASLDGSHGEQVLDSLAVLQSEGCAVVLASHDERCLRRADRVIKLADGRVQ
jgi:putative ABC transport system ATP-binding protein